MPKIVDHEQRKSEITKVVLKSIVKHGLANTTIRGIAREGKFSSGTLSHYFSNKDELILFAFNAATEETIIRITERTEKANTYTDKLRIFIEEFTPHSNASIDCKIMLTFWGGALQDQRLADKFQELYNTTRTYISDYLSKGVSAQEFDAHLDIEIETDLLVALCDGLLTAFLLDPEHTDDVRSQKLINASIQKLLNK